MNWLQFYSYFGRLEVYNRDRPADLTKEEIEEIGPLSQLGSFAIGAVVSLIVAIVFIAVSILLASLTPYFYAMPGWYQSVLPLPSLAFGYYVAFQFNLVNVDIQHRGVPALLGTRPRDGYTGEGLHWAPPEIVRIIEVNVLNQESDILPSEVLSKDGVDWDFNERVLWQVFDAWKRLNADIKDIETSVISAVEDATVTVFAKYDSETILESTDAIAKEILEIAERKVSVYGVRVFQIYFERLIPDPELVAEKRKFRIEAEQAKYRTKENDFLIKEVNRVTDEAGVDKKRVWQFFMAREGYIPATLDENQFSLDGETAQAIKDLADSAIEFFKSK